MLLMVLGTGTLGVLPVAQAQGRTAAAAGQSSSAPAADPGAEALLGNVVTAPGDGVATVPAAMISAPTTLEQRPAQFTTALPDQRAQIAIRTAMAQIGLPYVWGGDGPTNGDAGFDCSGLTTFSYAAAGVSLPRTAHTQYYNGPHVQQGAPLLPGDLVFYGTPARVHHVGLYLGEGKMVNAPTFGKPVQTAFYRYGGDDFLGATRPAATGTTSGTIPYAPPAPSTGAPQPFPAPTAPAPTTVPVATTAPPSASATPATTAPDTTAPVVTTTPSPASSTESSTTPAPSTSTSTSEQTTPPTTTSTPPTTESPSSTVAPSSSAPPSSSPSSSAAGEPDATGQGGGAAAPDGAATTPTPVP